MVLMMIKSISTSFSGLDFITSRINLDEWSQDIFDNAYKIYLQAQVKLDDTSLGGKKVEFKQKAVAAGLEKMMGSFLPKSILDKATEELSSLNISEERYYQQMVQISTIYLDAMSIVIREKVFTFPEKDRLLAEAYQLHNHEKGFPHANCAGYILYHLNMNSRTYPIQMKKAIVNKPGTIIYYADVYKDGTVFPEHIGLFLGQKGKEWIVISKWGEGPVVSHPQDRTLSLYNSTKYRLIQEPRYGIPLFRLIAERVEEVFKTERTAGRFHSMFPFFLSPRGVAKCWKQWIEETDKTMPLFSEAAMGERTRRICAKEFFTEWSPIDICLKKNPWAYSRTEVSERVKEVVVALDSRLYQDLFCSFWTEKFKEKI